MPTLLFDWRKNAAIRPLVGKMAGRGLFLLLSVVLLSTTPAPASTYLDISDDAYALLSRLEAEGVVRSGLLTTRPLSRKEAVRLLREAEKNSEGRREFIRGLVRSLERLIEPDGPGQVLHTPYARYVYSDDVLQRLNYNNDGDMYRRGSNFRAGFDAKLDDVGRFSLSVTPEMRLSEGRGDLVYKKAYAVFDFGWDLVLGKDSQWWGPGYHGALLLSNNAKPFTMARITNPEPVTLPWIFEYLGPFRFTFFVTNLEKDRADVPEPYLWGMRFNFKPHANVEIGLNRTALLGGRGRADDWSVWFHSLTSLGENALADEAGGQLAGYDIKLTLPFQVQPVQLYMEAGAEDGFHVLPNQWAFIYGLYLPGILSAERWELRFEWAETYDGNRASTWYTHHLYTDGYTYQDRIIGHHMGTNSRDTFTELTYRVPERNARVSLFLDIEEHNISKPMREKKEEIGLRGTFSLSDTVDLDVLYSGARIKNPGNEQRATAHQSSIHAAVTYRF